MPETSQPETPKGTLLIVDDEIGPRESLRNVFKGQYQVVTVTGGREGLDYAANNPVDVVILDILMPDLNGTDVLRELKLIDPRIEVIMLTGYETIESARAAVRYGAADYLSKPFDVVQMRETVAKCFEKRRLAAGADPSLQELQNATRELAAEVVERERKRPAERLSLGAVQDVTTPQPASRPVHYEPREEPALDWRQYGMILLERKWVAVTTFVVVVTLTLVWIFKQTPIYRATARIQVETQALKILNIQDVVSTEGRDMQDFNTQVKILQSRTLAEQAVKSLGLDQNPDFLPGAGPDTDFAGALQARLIIQPVRDSRLIDISADHPNRQMAALLASGVAREFIRQNLERKMSGSLEAVKWLRQQAEEYMIKVEKSEEALQEYREKTRVVSLEERQNIVVDKLKELNAVVTRAKTTRLAAETEWNAVKALQGAGQNPAQIPAIASSQSVSTLRQQLNDKQIAIAVLRERYRDLHPAILTALTELREIQSRFSKACEEAVEKLNADYLMAKAKEESLQQALSEQEQQALNLDRNLTQYNTLKRNAEADQQLYNAILVRMKEAGVTGKLETNNLRLVDAARTPSVPHKPRKARDALFGVILGLISGIGLTFLAHAHDDKIKSYEDMESLGVPLLSGVPSISLQDKLEKARVAQVDPHSISAEAFRSLRASIGLNPNLKGAKSLLITSTAPGEGKSLVAANLAIVFAHNNQRTLLIDGDLRHPIQHKVFNLQTDKGLSRFLADSTSFEETIQKTDIPNLDVITVGRVPPNPPELLGSNRLRELLEQASGQYDRIVIDSPPITAVSDPLILLPHVQGVIFIVHFGKVRREIVVQALKKLRDCGAPLVGAVINNIDLEQRGYYYHPYRYSYYYQQKKDSVVEYSHS